MYYVISFREEWESRCSMSCNCYRDSNRSSLISFSAKTYDELINKLVKRMSEDRKAEYYNTIFLSWDQFINQINWDYLTSNEFHIGNIEIDYDNDPDWEQKLDLNNAYYELEQRIKKDVYEKLKEKPSNAL